MPRLKALTLVELTVSIAITVMLIAVSFPLFNKDRGENLVEKEAQLVAAYIESARSMAQHPDNENAVKYTVKTDPTEKKLSITRFVINPGDTDMTEQESSKTPLTLTRSSVAISGLDFYTFSGEYKDGQETVSVKLISNPDIYKEIKISKPGVIDVIRQP